MPDYIEKLKQLEWSGNVRELRNVVERDYYLSEDELNAKEDCEVSLDEELLTNNEEVISMQELEKENIEKAIYSCEGNIVQAASRLNISRATIYRKIKKYNISVYHNEKILK
ncbi:Regulatory protein LuxO [compost metagenome]